MACGGDSSRLSANPPGGSLQQGRHPPLAIWAAEAASCLVPEEKSPGPPKILAYYSDLYKKIIKIVIIGKKLFWDGTRGNFYQRTGWIPGRSSLDAGL